jgi:hypothetical protein
MKELKVLKGAKIHFPYGRAKYVPEFVGGNDLKNSSDPAVRMDYIKRIVKEAVKEVFQLEEADDTLHETLGYVPFGYLCESKNKDLNEKVDNITDIVKELAGTMHSLPEIKVKSKDLNTCFSGETVPPEYVHFVHISFDKVLEYEEDKGFDWDCFLCALIGIAQIVLGVVILVMSGGTAYFASQFLIQEGISDIVFAIQSSYDGNFSWSAYGNTRSRA